MNKKSIETVFKERLANHQVEAPQGSWEAILEGLDGKKKKRRALVWWYSAAAILVAGLGLGLLNLNQDEQSDLQLVNQDSTPALAPAVGIEPVNPTQHSSTPINADELAEQSIANSTTDSQNSSSNNSNQSPTAVEKTQQIVTGTNSTNIATQNNTAQVVANSSTIPPATTSPKQTGTQSKESLKNSTVIALNKNDEQSRKSTQNEVIDSENSEFNFSKNATSDLLAGQLTPKELAALEQPLDSIVIAELALLQAMEQNQAEEKTEQKELIASNWQVGLVVSPVFTSSTGEGSPIDKRFSNSEKSYDSQMSFGLAAQYNIDNRWKLKTGINKMNISMNTHNLYASQAMQGNHLSNVETSMPAQYIAINTSQPLASNFGISSHAATVKHQMEFIEIPAEVAYVFFSDSKWNAHLAFGASSLFHINNTIHLNFAASDINLGESSNVNKVHFSGNLGLGVQYTIWKEMALQIEPNLRYHLNSFDNSGDFRPLNLGISTGVFYRF